MKNNVDNTIFIRESRNKLKNNGFLSKLSKGLMLPVAILPAAGLMLGIGSGITNIIIMIDPDASELVLFIPSVITQIGDIVFSNLPILFALGIAASFTMEAGVGVLAAFVAWMMFNATQSIFIREGSAENLANILWYNDVPNTVLTTNIGIESLQTSVFGGITIGLFASYLYNKFHTFEMPKVLGFFSGTRLVSILAFFITPIVGMGFLMIWPLFGIWLAKFGEVLANAPFGIDSFIFGIGMRGLIPLGLHHAFYTPLWFSSVGGQLLDGETYEVLAEGNQNIWFAFQTYDISYSVLNNMDNIVQVAGINYNEIISNTGETYLITEGVQPGNYLQGEYLVITFGLTAGGFAMIMAAQKEKRPVAMSIIGSSIFTAFLTGITEPLEFTFLFVAPILYYAFSVPMAGLAYWVMDMVNAHVGIAFSGGVIDMVLYGFIPDISGMQVKSWVFFIFGPIWSILYYFVFYFWILKFDVKTPGREINEEINSLISKQDYENKKNIKKKSRNERVEILIEALGGLENLNSINACITRLRLTVKNREKIDDEKLKSKLGAAGIIGKGKSIQIVFGAEADIFKSELIKLKGSSN